MKIAIGLPVALPGRPGSSAVEWARRAEAAGFSSLGTIGRIVFDNQEELIALAAAAGATERIGLATTLLISPARESVLLAKQAATLDAISNGRLSLGVGVGWRDDDYRATGRDYGARGKLLEEQIAVMKRVWAGESPLPGIDPVGPPPARPGGPELIMGGTAPAALRRAGRLADGFLSIPGTADAIRGFYGQVVDAWEAAGRSGRPRLLGAAYFALGDPEKAAENIAAYYAVGGQGFVDTMVQALLATPDAIRQTLESYEKAGVDEAFFWPELDDPDQVEALAKITR